MIVYKTNECNKIINLLTRDVCMSLVPSALYYIFLLAYLVKLTLLHLDSAAQAAADFSSASPFSALPAQTVNVHKERDDRN